MFQSFSRNLIHQSFSESKCKILNQKMQVYKHQIFGQENPITEPMKMQDDAPFVRKYILDLT